MLDLRTLLAILPAIPAIGLAACAGSYDFAGVKMLGGPDGRVHVAAPVDLQDEGGGGMVRLEVASYGPKGVERSRVGASRLAEQGMFTDAAGALLLVAHRWPDPPIARRDDGGWKRVALAPDLSDEARAGMDYLEYLGTGWTDAGGATRAYAPTPGLGGWVYALDGGRVTGASKVAAPVSSPFRIERPAADRLYAWVRDDERDCDQPCRLACDSGACAWQCDAAVCLAGSTRDALVHTAKGVPVAAEPAWDAATGKVVIRLASPDGGVDVPLDASVGGNPDLRLAPRTEGGLLALVWPNRLTELTVLVFDEDFAWRSFTVPTEADVDWLMGADVVASRDGTDGETAHVAFATGTQVTHVAVVLATGEQRRDSFGL